MSAAEVLRTVTELNSSDANVLKSNERSRLVPPAASVPPFALIASMPLMRTRVNCGPRPRTLICRPSPPSRAIDTPGTRWMRFGEIQIGEVGDVLGDDRVDRADRVALLVERDAQALAEAGDDDLFDGRFLRGRGQRYGAQCRKATAGTRPPRGSNPTDRLRA